MIANNTHASSSRSVLNRQNKPLCHGGIPRSKQIMAASNIHESPAVSTVISHEISGSRRHMVASGLVTALSWGLAAALPPVALAAAPGAPQILLNLPGCGSFKRGGSSSETAFSFCDMEIGTGPVAESGELIEVDYVATAVATGLVFEGSRNFRFTLGQDEVIPGWEAGILGSTLAASDSGTDLVSIPPMREGGARTIIIPAKLAYGSRGNSCLFGLDSKCRVPPGSDVEITFRYRGLVG